MSEHEQPILCTHCGKRFGQHFWLPAEKWIFSKSIWKNRASCESGFTFFTPPAKETRKEGDAECDTHKTQPVTSLHSEETNHAVSSNPAPTSQPEGAGDDINPHWFQWNEVTHSGHYVFTPQQYANVKANLQSLTAERDALKATIEEIKTSAVIGVQEDCFDNTHDMMKNILTIINRRTL